MSSTSSILEVPNVVNYFFQQLQCTDYIEDENVRTFISEPFEFTNEESLKTKIDEIKTYVSHFEKGLRENFYIVNTDVIYQRIYSVGDIFVPGRISLKIYVKGPWSQDEEKKS